MVYRRFLWFKRTKSTPPGCNVILSCRRSSVSKPSNTSFISYLIFWFKPVFKPSIINFFSLHANFIFGYLINASNCFFSFNRMRNQFTSPVFLNKRETCTPITNAKDLHCLFRVFRQIINNYKPLELQFSLRKLIDM